MSPCSVDFMKNLSIFPDAFLTSPITGVSRNQTWDALKGVFTIITTEPLLLLFVVNVSQINLLITSR